MITGRYCVVAVAVCVVSLTACSSSAPPRVSEPSGSSAALGSTTQAAPTDEPTPSAEPDPVDRSTAPSIGAVESPDSDFSVVLPTGWRDNPSAAQSISAATLYAGPDDNGFTANVNVVREQLPQRTTLRSYFTSGQAKLRAAIQTSQVGSVGSVTIDGTPALQWTFTDTQQGRLLRQRQTVVVRGGIGYVITFTATQDDFASAGSDAAEIVDSWNWGPAA